MEIKEEKNERDMTKEEKDGKETRYGDWR